jgi:hypothetical protein
MPSPTSASQSPWAILQGAFSVMTVGIAFHNDTTGWTSVSKGSTPMFVETLDGGRTWADTVEGSAVMPMALAATKAPSPIRVVTAGLAASKYSKDGRVFGSSRGASLLGVQSVRLNRNGSFAVQAGENEVYLSADGGATYHKSAKVPLLYESTGRYVAAPSRDVIYLTAGQWPVTGGRLISGARPLSRNLAQSKTRIYRGESAMHDDGGSPPRSNPHGEAGPIGMYSAELWKSSDGGKSWSKLFNSTAEFYFNEIDCFDETHCVAVGEGFGKDGSTSPGARVYVTDDGLTFKLAHHDKRDGASLMSAKMISRNEHFAGGSAGEEATDPILALHSKDAGGSYIDEGADSGIVGHMITAMDFASSSHGYATTVNALQLCSLLEYGKVPSRAA